MTGKWKAESSFSCVKTFNNIYVKQQLEPAGLCLCADILPTKPPIWHISKALFQYWTHGISHTKNMQTVLRTGFGGKGFLRASQLPWQCCLKQ